MIPELPPSGSAHNRSLLEELLILLAEAGFDIHLFYLAGIDIDHLISELQKLLQKKPIGWH